MRELWAPQEPVVVRAEGLVLREWAIDDTPTLVALFDTEEMNRWTPLASPFDLAAALGYVETAHRLRSETGLLQLAVTENGSTPLGEVLLFPADGDDQVELAYAVGAPFQGRGLARRAVRAAVSLAADAGMAGARLVIATDNVRSQAVARAVGFSPAAVATFERQRKGYVLEMATWERVLRDEPLCGEVDDLGAG